MRATITRREWLFAAGASALAPRAAFAAPDPSVLPNDLEIRDLRIPGDRVLGRRFLLFVPKHIPSGQKMPLLVLLHGLGETIDETLGVRAWVDRYGLGTSYDRLRRPPIARTSKRKDFSDERLDAVNADLKRRPFLGYAIACPFTPKATATKELDQYAKWLVDEVVPRARREVSIHEGAAAVALDGCSLGGFIALETFIRHPQAFGALGGVQSAITEGNSARYADRLQAALDGSLPKRIHIETSREDVFRKGNERLSAELDKRGIKNDLLVIPGWHDQPWLREAGTIEMLLWHDRRFGEALTP